MKQTKLLLLGFLLIIAAGCSDHEHSNQGHSYDSTTNSHDSI